MVKGTATFGIDPAMGHRWRERAFASAPPAARDAVVALFALDAMLAKLARHTREPMVAQMRLAWWREALDQLADAPVSGQPILAALRRDGVAGAALTRVVDGWEALILGDLAAHGRERGRGLFEAVATVLGADDAWVGDAGEGWALADLALTSPIADVAAAARERATPLLHATACARSSHAARPLRALTTAAQLALGTRGRSGTAHKLRFIRFGLIGR